jgi:outer membrane autotransporter protein
MTGQRRRAEFADGTDVSPLLSLCRRSSHLLTMLVSTIPVRCGRANQYLHLNDFDDGISSIGANTTNGLRGRVGFRLFKANLSNDSKTSTVTPYFTANVLHDFFAPGQVTIGGTSLDNELGKTWYELGIGVTGNFSRHSELYANVRYAHDLSGEYRRTVFAQAGYRFSW